MKKILLIFGILSLFILPIVFAQVELPKEPYFPEPIILDTGWNGVAIKLNESFDVVGDINVSLSSVSTGWNFFGYSSNDPCSINSVTFTDSNGDTKTWQEAKDANWVGILVYPNETEVQLPLGNEESAFRFKMHDAFWINVTRDLNMTFQGVGGTDPNEVFMWKDVRFWNGSEERNITDAGDAGWVQKTLKYYDNGFKDIEGSINPLLGKTNISSWEGIFVNSHVQDLYMLTGNETNPYTLTFKYKSKNWTIGNSNTLRLRLEGNNFIVESDNKLTFRYLIRRLTRLLNGRWRN